MSGIGITPATNVDSLCYEHFHSAKTAQLFVPIYTQTVPYKTFTSQTHTLISVIKFIYETSLLLNNVHLYIINTENKETFVLTIVDVVCVVK